MSVSETVPFSALIRQAEERCHALLVEAGVPREYTDQLVTAFVKNGKVGFSYLQVQGFYEAGVPPEYANVFIGAVGCVTVDEAIDMFRSGVDASLGVVGARKGLSAERIKVFMEAGIAPEYLDEMYPDLVLG